MTGAGAAIRAIAGGGKGATIGAGIGSGAGVGMPMATKGAAAEFPAEFLTFRTKACHGRPWGAPRPAHCEHRPYSIGVDYALRITELQGVPGDGSGRVLSISEAVKPRRDKANHLYESRASNAGSQD